MTEKQAHILITLSCRAWYADCSYEKVPDEVRDLKNYSPVCEAFKCRDCSIHCNNRSKAVEDTLRAKGKMAELDISIFQGKRVYGLLVAAAG